jgi:SAM-dependent methyltransferase
MTDKLSVHNTAARGFGQNAAEYELARPGYPPDAVAFLTERLGLGPGQTVLDVGAGTGKLTRLLMPTGASLVAVEPVAAMRAQFQRSLPGVTVHDATANHLPVEDGSADAIVCAQAFHWFATVETLEEFARVLKPGRLLALVWNTRDYTVPWVQRFTELLRGYEGGRPDHHRGSWREVFDADVLFTPLEQTTFFHEQTMTPDLLVARAASMSFIGAMGESARAEILQRVHQLGSEQGRSFVLPYRTEVYLTTRR